MNIYFLFEGKRTETKIYPKYLSYLIPELKQINNYEEIDKNNYYIFSSSGYPSVYDDIANAIYDINENNNYDYFVICSDAEEMGFEVAKENIEEILTENKLKKAIPVIIIQNVCIETWFLGNRKVFKENPQNDKLSDYIKFYNIKENDAENMGNNGKFNTIAQFHEDYLRLLLNERNMCYSKGKTDDVASKNYFDELVKRTETTKHLQSFKVFIDFCLKVKQELQIL